MRSMTERRSDPPASSQDAWAWRRSWMRTLKSTPLALTAGVQMRLRKVLRERGAGPGGEEQVVWSETLVLDPRLELV